MAKKLKLQVFRQGTWTPKSFEFEHGLRILKLQELRGGKPGFKLAEDEKYDFKNGALVNKPKQKTDDSNRTTSEEIHKES